MNSNSVDAVLIFMGISLFSFILAYLYFGSMYKKWWISKALLDRLSTEQEEVSTRVRDMKNAELNLKEQIRIKQEDLEALVYLQNSTEKKTRES